MMPGFPIRLALAAAIALPVAACMPHPPPAAMPSEIVSGAAQVPLARIPVTAGYLGTYRSGGDTLTVARAGDQLVLQPAGGAPSILQPVGLGTFVDPSGTAWLFVPADGSGGRLRSVSAGGAAREWVR